MNSSLKNEIIDIIKALLRSTKHQRVAVMFMILLFYHYEIILSLMTCYIHRSCDTELLPIHTWKAFMMSFDVLLLRMYIDHPIRWRSIPRIARLHGATWILIAMLYFTYMYYYYNGYAGGVIVLSFQLLIIPIVKLIWSSLHYLAAYLIKKNQ